MRRMLASWVYALGYRRCTIGTRRLGDGTARLAEGLRLAPFDLGDVLPLIPLGAQHVDEVPQRLARGDTPWGLWKADELVCYGWSSQAPTSVTRDVVLSPGPREVYLFDFFTPPAHRGQAYYPQLLQAMCAALGAQGHRCAWIVVFRSNHASLRGIEKAGFQRAGAYVTFAGRVAFLKPSRGERCPLLRPRSPGWQWTLPVL